MVSFIILNYNSSSFAISCVQSILKYIPQGGYEVIVVDNASNPEELAILKNGINADVQVVELKWNTGFGLGNMMGANMAKGDYLCFINSDVEFCEDCVSPLLSYLNNHPEVGCVTPQQYGADGKQKRSFKHNTGIRHKLFGDRFFEKHFPEKFTDRRKYYQGDPYTVSQLNGCFMLFPTDVFWKIGGFDTNIFLYHEEYDIGIRLKKEGLSCVVLPEYKFIHLGSATISKLKHKTYIEHRISQMYAYRKHHNLFLSTIYKWICLTGVVFNPKKWFLLKYMIRSEAMSLSMRHEASKTKVKDAPKNEDANHG